MNITLRYIALVTVIMTLTAFAPYRDGGETGHIVPALNSVVTHENQYLLAFTISEKSIMGTIVYEPWDTSVVLGMASKSDRGGVVDALEKMVPARFVAGGISCVEYPYHAKPESTTTGVSFESRTTITDLLRKDTSSNGLRRILNTEVPYARISIFGWVQEMFSAQGNDRSPCTGNFVATTILLNPGFNRVYLEYMGNGGAILGKDSLALFYATGSGENAPSTGFLSESFHKTAREAACKSCHSESAGQNAPLKCNSCHGGLAVQNHVHGPVAGGDCSSCHYEEPDSGYAVRFAKSEESQSCLNCHDTIEKNLKANPVVHKPVQKGLCLTCHSPHGSAYGKQLRRSINDQCFSCHAEKRDGDHPVVFHPVGDRPDSRPGGKDLTCLSCHTPHASENIDLMLVSGGYFAVCQNCHQK